MKALNFLYTLLAVLVLVSCDQQVLPVDLVRYVNHPDHGLTKRKTLGPLKVELQYKPHSYVIANELRSNQIGQQVYRQRLKELDGLQYYNLKISVPKLPGQDITTYRVNDPGEEQQRLYYLSFQMKENIRLIQGQDTLAPVLYHFERSFDLSPHRTFVMAFEEPLSKSPEDRTFILDSPVLGTGPLKLKITAKDLDNIPDIKLL